MDSKSLTHLILVRHGESTYNAKGLFTGRIDAKLTEKGKAQAAYAGMLCQAIPIQHVHSSMQERAYDTCHIMGEKIRNFPNITRDSRLNERDYGSLTGQKKIAAEAHFGADQVEKWRRGFYDCPPEGESLFQAYSRTTDWFEECVFSQITKGNNVLVGAHGNTLRPLIGYLLSYRHDQFRAIEVAWCSPWILSFQQNRLHSIVIHQNPMAPGNNQLPHCHVPVTHEKLTNNVAEKDPSPDLTSFLQ